jgi:hypothetical protein
MRKKRKNIRAREKTKEGIIRERMKKVKNETEEEEWMREKKLQ